MAFSDPLGLRDAFDLTREQYSDIEEIIREHPPDEEGVDKFMEVLSNIHCDVFSLNEVDSKLELEQAQMILAIVRDKLMASLDNPSANAWLHDNGHLTTQLREMSMEFDTHDKTFIGSMLWDTSNFMSRSRTSTSLLLFFMFGSRQLTMLGAYPPPPPGMVGDIFRKMIRDDPEILDQMLKSLGQRA